MSNSADFIKENSQTLGTGSITLNGAVDSSVGRFSDAWSAETEVFYAILDGANREAGIGTFNGSTSLTRRTIHSTVENGVYNDVNPTAIDLGGQAIVACTMNADAFNDVLSDIASNTANIATNTANININAGNISASTSAIAANTANIAINTDAIAVNASNIQVNTDDLSVLDNDVSYREVSITALETGGAVTQNGPAVISIAAGQGEIIDSYTDTEVQATKEVMWDEIPNFDLIAAGGMPAETGIGYTEIGMQKPTEGDGVATPVAYVNGISAAQRRSVIRLCGVEYVDRVIIKLISAPIVSNQIGNTLMDLVDYVDLSARVKGLLLRPTTVGNLTVWRDSGEIFAVGSNYEAAKDNPNISQIPAVGAVDAPILFTPLLYTAGTTSVGLETDLIDSDEFEEDPVGGGGLENISNGHTVIHYMLQSIAGSFFMSYAQREYDDHDEAISNLFADRSSHLFPEETNSMILLAQIVVDKNASVWGADAEIYPLGSAVSSGSSGGSATAARNITYTDVYNLGTNVQSAIDSLAALKLSANQHDAINAADTPSTANPYAVISDITAVTGDFVNKTDTDRQTIISELELPDGILSALDTEINQELVVDVFIYDTSQDDDGGLWVEQSITPFVKLGIITLEATLLTVYDAVNGSVFTTIVTAGATSVTAKNGVIYIGTSTGFKAYDINNNYAETDWSSLIVNTIVHDCAVTSDGNMNNIVAVATDGGTSFIYPDGSIVDLTDTVSGSDLVLNKDLVGISTGSPAVRFGMYPTTDNTAAAWRAYVINPSTTTPAILSATPSPLVLTSDNKNKTFIGQDLGLNIFEYGELIDTANNNGMIAYTTDLYATGFMQGDIKGAFLCNDKTSDRSVNANNLNEVGTLLSLDPVATGAELMAVSGFTVNDYLQQDPNADLDFGTGDFYVSFWVKNSGAAAIQYILNRRDGVSTDYSLYIYLNVDGTIVVTRRTTSNNITTGVSAVGDIWTKVDVSIVDDTVYIYFNGVLDVAGNAVERDLTNTDANLFIGVSGALGNPLNSGSLALLRIGAGAPTAEAIKNIYLAEKPLFAENAKCLLQNGSNDVKALDFNESSNILTVCDAIGTTQLNGLAVVSEPNTDVATSVSTNNDMEVYGS